MRKLRNAVIVFNGLSHLQGATSGTAGGSVSCSRAFQHDQMQGSGLNPQPLDWKTSILSLGHTVPLLLIKYCFFRIWHWSDFFFFLGASNVLWCSIQNIRKTRLTMINDQRSWQAQRNKQQKLYLFHCSLSNSPFLVLLTNCYWHWTVFFFLPPDLQIIPAKCHRGLEKHVYWEEVRPE